MPWAPELFSAPILARLEEQEGRPFTTVPFFEGVLTGEVDALTGSFAGEPELHHPVRGRVRGAAAFARYVTDTATWLGDRRATIEHVDHLVTPLGGHEEVILHLVGDAGPFELPVGLTGDRRGDGRLTELRMYYRTWALTGGRTRRLPLLQPDAGVHGADVVGDHVRALAAADVDAAVGAFEPGGYVRGAATHRGADELRALHGQLLSGGGIALQQCRVYDDGRICPLEFNVVASRGREVAPEAGMAVYARGESGRLAALRVYGDVGPD
jgi:hypothetical protein